MIAKILRAVLVGLTVTALAAVLVFLYAKTRSVDADKKAQIEGHLKQMKQLDAEWNVDVLKSRMELNKKPGIVWRHESQIAFGLAPFLRSGLVAQQPIERFALTQQMRAIALIVEHTFLQVERWFGSNYISQKGSRF